LLYLVNLNSVNKSRTQTRNIFEEFLLSVLWILGYNSVTFRKLFCYPVDNNVHAFSLPISKIVVEVHVGAACPSKLSL
jgi:hypothetical protein